MLKFNVQEAIRRIGDRSGRVDPFAGSPGQGTHRAAGDVASLDATQVADKEAIRKIKDLPKEVGVILVSVGVFGFVLPGVMGTPAIIAGGLILWPRAFGGLEDYFRRRQPGLHHRSMQQVGRFLADLERRYPQSPSRPGQGG